MRKVVNVLSWLRNSELDEMMYCNLLCQLDWSLTFHFEFIRWWIEKYCLSKLLLSGLYLLSWIEMADWLNNKNAWTISFPAILFSPLNQTIRWALNSERNFGFACKSSSEEGSCTWNVGKELASWHFVERSKKLCISDIESIRSVFSPYLCLKYQLLPALCVRHKARSSTYKG